MGLDMNLYKHTYVGNKYKKDDEKVTINNLPHIKTERISTIVEELAYWRKANSIHNWFVQNVQRGVDTGQESYVEVEKLQELLDTINEVIDKSILIDGQVHNGTTWTKDGTLEHWEPGKVILNPEVAESLLPTQSGFFFGGTNYDQWYYEQLEYTRDILTEILAEEAENVENKLWCDYYYRASW